MKIKDIVQCLEEIAPLSYQEIYDNCGLICGDENSEATSVLLSLDCTESIVDEAIAEGCNLIVAHHPIVFKGLKRLTGSNYVERTLIKAIRNNIAIYACHTNLDNVREGVNRKIGEKLGLKALKILAPKTGLLRKLVTFVPATHLVELRRALFKAGAGHIGNYDSCSFGAEGIGTFKGNEDSKPFLGKATELSNEPEIRLEVICEEGNEKRVVAALREHHPYEEPAFDMYSLNNAHPGIGSGMIGVFEAPMEENAFLKHLKTTFNCGVVRHTQLLSKPIRSVAFCGGSGSFLLGQALRNQADAYVSADFKYHEFFDSEDKLLVADVGHFETEQFTPEIFYEVIRNKFPKFAIRLSKRNTNPIHYF